MRKRMIAEARKTPQPPEQDWLKVEDLAEVEITSEDAELSVWLWGESPVKNPGRSPLLHPKPVDLESVPILAPTAMYEKADHTPANR